MLDSKGNMYIEDDDIIELMLSNRQFKILPKNKDGLLNFETQCKRYGLAFPFEIDSEIDDISWNMPLGYKTLDIKDYILNKHSLSNEQVNRINQELLEFESRNLIDLLRFLVYLVDTLRSNGIIYGVGRGSSIASYVLYLIGIHRIDSFKYNLDIKEFLK